MKQFQHGFIIGKFMPLHNGHCLVIDTALDQCEQITICLMSQPDEAISGEVRLGWLSELYGVSCTILHHTATLPRDKSGHDHWEQWLASITKVCSGAYDAVFSSELYGERLATDLGADHVLIDLDRLRVPISGTSIRDNPTQYFEYLPAVVKSYYENSYRN